MKIVTIFTALVLLTTGAAYAKKSCTEEPKEKWMTETAFKKKVTSEGFKIRKFKQTGSCYEIYGTDESGSEVELYFNPVDGSVVKRK